MAVESEHEESRSCDRCGGPDALEVGGRSVCEACFALSGSCCLEFGADDLWKDRDGVEENPAEITAAAPRSAEAAE